MKRLKIAVLFGGCSPEYSVSLQSAAAVLQNMDSSKYWGQILHTIPLYPPKHLKACRYHGNCKECVAIHRAHQEHVPNCMRPLINKKLKLMSELTEHTLANEIEAPHEILRK